MAITLLVGARPGSGPDHWARSFAPFLERHWPHATVAVLNRPGEAGLAAARAIAGAPPDGQLIGAVATPLLQARAVEAGAAGLLDRLDFIAAVAEEPLVLVGHPGTTADLAALRALGPLAVLGTPPHGSAPHLAGLALGLALPLRLLVSNAAAARQAVVAGNIACAMLAAPDAIAALRDDRLVALGIAQESRSPLLPEVSTLQEQGIPLLLVAHRGFALPPGGPPARLAALGEALRAAVADPEFVAQAQALGYVPRFLGQGSWEPMLRRVTQALVARWITDPWRAGGTHSRN